MKIIKICLKVTLFVIFGVSLAGGCKYDDTDIQTKYDELEKRIHDLETLCDGFNQDIRALRTIVEAIERNDYIELVKYDEINDHTVISFHSGLTITLRDGRDGKNGDTPVIGVKQDEDGIWYWTVNGRWLLNDSNEKIRATGNSGKNGITPLLKIVDGYWMISYDNGEKWEPLGKAEGANGKDGDSFFSSIDSSNAEYVLFYLTDGSCIKVAKHKESCYVFTLGNEYNLTPNYPTNVELNPWWFSEGIKHKGFGSICVGRNNELWMITRVSNSHGTGGGNLYWSVSHDEGNTWAAPTKFALDNADTGVDPEYPGKGGPEDLRDAFISYDVLSDRYYLTYVHQYGIKADANGRYTDYSLRSGDFKCFVGYEPFVNMYDISMQQDGFPDSPHALGDKAPGNRLQQCFGPLVRVGNYLYLAFYYGNWEDEQHTTIQNTDVALYRLVVNDHDPLSVTYWAYSWENVKTWEEFNDDNEAAFYVTYKTDGSQRFNIVSRRGASGKGYYYYSDDGGNNWSEKRELGFLVAGGPTVYNFDGGWLLLSREQGLSNHSNVLLRYSRDGNIWDKPMMVSDCPSGYCSFATLKSGKNVICYSKESGNIGIQAIRELKVSEK